MYQTFEELTESEELCNYCKAEPGWHSSPNGYSCCEGAYCNDAYQRYLDDNETTENIIKYQNSVKLINKESLNG